MQNNLLSKLQVKIKELFHLDEQDVKNLLHYFAQQMKNYMKEEKSSISKQLAKKTKQLFILSSDNQTYKQKVQEMENKIKKLNEKLSQKQKEMVKIMNDKERQQRELQQNMKKIKQSLQEQKKLLEMKIFDIEIKNKAELSDLRRHHKQEISKAIQKEQEIAENNLLKLKQQFILQKKNLVQIQNKQRSELIKKYEFKLQDLRDKNQEQLKKLTKQFSEVKEKDHHIKLELQNQLIRQQNLTKKLQGQLRVQSMGHQKYKKLSDNLQSQLQQLNLTNKTSIEKLQAELQKTIEEKKQLDKSKKAQINKLQNIIQQTIKEKDLLFEQTVNSMKNDHHIELQALKNNLMEERQIAINQVQIKHYNETEKLNGQFYDLQKKYITLQKSYKSIKDQYEEKISHIISDYQAKINSIQTRSSYQLNLQGQTAKKTTQSLERKYKLEIKSLKKQYNEMKEELIQKINDEKISTTNKLTSKYETMINDIKVNNEVSLKQKIMQFERKSKGYEKKLTELQKRRVDLKLHFDRHKLDSQIKIESLMDINEKQETQIEDLHQHLLKVEKQKTKIANQYEFKLLVKNNEIQQIKDDYEIKQQQLRNILNQKIRIKNLEISKFSSKIMLEVQSLLQKNKKRVTLIEKQYAELKKIMAEKTSLPQDIEALKIFHRGYVKLEEELQNEKKLKQDIQRELQSKCVIQKVFVNRNFIPKIQEKIPIKFTTAREFYNKDDKIIKFKSQNL